MAMASCSQDETVKVNQGEAISFRAFTDNLTRATEVNNSNLGSFKVHALQGTNANGATAVWTDTYKNSGGTYSSSNDHYFPGDGTPLHFFAYNEGNLPTAGDAVTVTGSTQKITNLTPDATAADQKDLVIAYEKGSHTASGGKASQEVAINFKHVYSQIRVEAKNTNASLRVTVLGVRLNGFNSKTDFTFPTTSTNTTKTSVLDWSAYGTQDNKSNKDGDYQAIGEAKKAKQLGSTPVSLITLSDQDADKKNSFMVLPQKLTQWSIQDGKTDVNGSYISVLCRIEQKKDATGSQWSQVFPDAAKNPDHQDKYAWTAIPFTVENGILPGTCYTVTLDFSNGGGTTDPEQPTGPDTDPIVPVDPSKPVLGNKLSFKVTVSDWKTADSNLNM